MVVNYIGSNYSNGPVHSTEMQHSKHFTLLDNKATSGNMNLENIIYKSAN
jgi:hypothetical protein